MRWRPVVKMLSVVRISLLLFLREFERRITIGLGTIFYGSVGTRKIVLTNYAVYSGNYILDTERYLAVFVW